MKTNPNLSQRNDRQRNKFFILHSSFFILLLVLSVTFLPGCTKREPIDTASPLPDQLSQYIADARTLGELGTLSALLENASFRKQLEYTVLGLKELEAQPDNITLDSLTAVLARLPVKELQTPHSRFYIVGGRLLLRRLFGAVDVGSIASIRPIVKALREGMEAGLRIE